MVSTEALSCPHCGVPRPTLSPEPDLPTSASPDAAGSPPDESESASWYYLRDDRKHGPCTRRELLDLLHRGEIAPETRVQSQASPYWLPLRMVPELSPGGPGSLPARDTAPAARARPARSLAGGTRGTDAEADPGGKTLTTVIYALQGLGVFTLLPYVVAVVLNYARMDAVRGSWLESHFRWQIDTFWLSILGSVLGIMLALFLDSRGIVWLTAVAVPLWVVYRVVAGWLRLLDQRPVDPS